MTGKKKDYSRLVKVGTVLKSSFADRETYKTLVSLAERLNNSEIFRKRFIKGLVSILGKTAAEELFNILLHSPEGINTLIEICTISGVVERRLRNFVGKFSIIVQKRFQEPMKSLTNFRIKIIHEENKEEAEFELHFINEDEQQIISLCPIPVCLDIAARLLLAVNKTGRLPKGFDIAAIKSMLLESPE